MNANEEPNEPQAHIGADALEHVVAPLMRKGGRWWQSIEAFGAQQRWASPVIEQDVYVHVSRNDPMRIKHEVCSAVAADGTRWEWPAALTEWPTDETLVWLLFDTCYRDTPWRVDDCLKKDFPEFLRKKRCFATREGRDQAERAWIALNGGTPADA